MVNTNKSWSAYEDTVLELMLPDYSFRDIALKLGRTVVSVQHRASYRRLSQRAVRAEETNDQQEYYEGQREANLLLSEDDLSDYLPVCEEEPVAVHYGSKAYYRAKWAERQSG